MQTRLDLLMSNASVKGQQKSEQPFTPYNSHITAVGAGGEQGEWAVEVARLVCIH